MITEIASFLIRSDLDIEQFTAIVDELERDFHKKKDGFIDTELLYNSDSSYWIMIQHWNSITLAQFASREMFKDQSTLKFREALIPNSVKITYNEIIKEY